MKSKWDAECRCFTSGACGSGLRLDGQRQHALGGVQCVPIVLAQDHALPHPPQEQKLHLGALAADPACQLDILQAQGTV